MEALATLGIYLGFLVFITLIGILARQVAVAFAKRKGWTATSMPLKYSVWFIAVTGVVWVVAWAVLENVVLK